MISSTVLEAPAGLPHQDHADRAVAASRRAADRALDLTLGEWLFLAAVILSAALGVIFIGKDTSWDFRNYHWYIPYALLNGRMGFDVAVAHQATYYNPMLDVPFYWLATHTRSWFALGVLGAVQGSNAVPLYVMARQSLRIPEKKLGAALLALLGLSGALTLSLFGTTYYDNVMSVFLLSALAIVVARRETLARGSLWRVFYIVACASFLAGCAVGLKLPEAPFALGFGAALLVVGGDIKHLAVRIAAGGLGGIAGMLCCAGYWFARMYSMTGNPLFPYFNQYFHSALALAAPYRDERFLPSGFWNVVLFPLRFTADWTVADDLPFRDMRVGLAYVAVIAVLLLALFRQRARDPFIAPAASRMLIGFAGISYLAWIAVFGIYRYIVCLELLAPLVIVAAIGGFPLGRRLRFVALGFSIFAILVYARSDFLNRAPLGDPYVQADIPKFEHPDKTMILLTGNAPLGYLATLMPRRIPLVRIDGWMMQPNDGTELTRQMRARVHSFKGDLYLLAEGDEMVRGRDALVDYDLAIGWIECRTFDSNLTGPYKICPLFPRPR